MKVIQHFFIDAVVIITLKIPTEIAGVHIYVTIIGFTTVRRCVYATDSEHGNSTAVEFCTNATSELLTAHACIATFTDGFIAKFCACVPRFLHSKCYL